jgi:hypothetical protein
LSNPVAITTGEYNSCARDDSGIHCWGYNGYGESTVPALATPWAVSAGYSHTCALAATGVVCWGDNANGQVSGPVRTPQDNCPFVYNPDQLDGDADGIGDACEP